MIPGVYGEIWHDFHSGEHISRAAIWGGEGFALVVPVEDGAVVARVIEIQQRLKRALPFQPHLPETLHITLYLFGSPSTAQLPGLIAFLSGALQAVPAFTIDLPRINSFFRAPFIEVQDGGALNRLMDTVQPGLVEQGFPPVDYGPRGQVWHITLGAYTQSNDGAAARALISELRSIKVGRLPVTELRLVKTSAGEPYRLHTQAVFTLADRL